VQIGQIVDESFGSSPAVLSKNQGVFTIGPSEEAALKSEVMVEEIARMVWLALQIGQPDEIPAELMEELRYCYQHVYGQTEQSRELKQS